MYDEYVACRYCKFATAMAHSHSQMLCEKNGVVDALGKCKKFDLNLLSIQPPNKKRGLLDKKNRFTVEDFSIE